MFINESWNVGLPLLVDGRLEDGAVELVGIATEVRDAEGDGAATKVDDPERGGGATKVNDPEGGGGMRMLLVGFSTIVDAVESGGGGGALGVVVVGGGGAAVVDANGTDVESG